MIPTIKVMFHHVNLMSNKSYLMTILAQNVDEEVFVFLGHWCHENLTVQIIPQLLHVEHRLLTGWTSVIAGNQQLLKACPVK